MKMGSAEAMRSQPPLDPPHDCETDGHEMKCLGTAEDGTVFYECRVCGETHES